MDFATKQATRRAILFAVHQRTIAEYWDDDGQFCWKNPAAEGGYRALLGHCYSYLYGDAHCVEKANRIIIANRTLTPDHFTPSAAADVLIAHRSRLTPEALACLRQYLRHNLPYMSTDDLRIKGYNDNHPMKAIHALILGGELLDCAEYVEIGLRKLREAVTVFQRNGFPSEYNSPNYTQVSLKPLADLVEHATHPEARELAMRLEHFFWQDLALHIDPATGLPAGPYSRGYVNDYSGLLSGTLCLLSHLFPERYDFDLIEEVFGKGETSPLIDPAIRDTLPFYQYHLVWYAAPTYHLTEDITAVMFEKASGASVRGMVESSTFTLGWARPEDQPTGAPAVLPLGPRRGLITTYYGDHFSLGTAQYSWLDNGQSHGFFATVSTGPRTCPQDAAVYAARMYYDERSPYGESPYQSGCFRDDGEIRTVQYRNTALVFYNPLPYFRQFSSLQTGIFRPLIFHEPKALFVGEIPVKHLNGIFERLAPIAIDEGDVYLGFLPLRLTDLGQKRQAHLQIHTYSDRLAILMSSLESWQPQAFDYATILGVCAGFVCEVHAAADFSSFANFRHWLAQAAVADHYSAGQFAYQRMTTYTRKGLCLSAAYSPFQSAFRFVTVNGAALPHPLLSIEGMNNPGHDLLLSPTEIALQ